MLIGIKKTGCRKLIAMNKKYSMIFNVLALLIVVLLIIFWFSYYSLVQLPIANMRTKIVFWIINSVGTLFIIGLIFFKKWIFARRKKIIFSLLIFFLGLTVIEVGLHIVDKRQMKFSPHPYLNYSGTPGYKSMDGLNMHNSLGFRGPEIEIPKPKGRIRIALLGGSTTYEDFVKDWRKDWARRLEQDLRQSFPKKDIEVINAGLPGWDSWEDLVNLEFRLLDLDLDLIILYEGANDVHARFVKPSAYKADNSGNKKHWEREICFDPRCLKIVQMITGFDNTSFDIIAPSAALFLQSDGYNSVLGMTPMEVLSKNPPLYSERNLRNIIAIANENKIHIMLSTWAWTNRFSNDYTSSKHYEKGFQDQNNMIKNVGKLKNVPVFDFASEMPMDLKYWGDGRHNDEEGVKLKGKLFANFIIKNKLLEILSEKEVLE